MLRFKPLKNMCFSDNDIWFLSRGINALFKYSNDSKKVEFISLPGCIDMEYVYLGTHYYDDKIYLPPVYGKGFGEYDIRNRDFRQIITPNSQAFCNFGWSFAEENFIYCTPNVMKGPFVTFDMKKKMECSEPFYFPKEYISDEYWPTIVQKVSNGIYYGLISPINVIYKLNFLSGRFRFYQVDFTEKEIRSFWVEGEKIYIFVSQEIIVTDLDMNIIAKSHVESAGRMYALGKFGNGIFLDDIDSSVKMILKIIDGNICFDYFDETGDKFVSARGIPGIIQNSDRPDKCYYFSAGNGGVYVREKETVDFIKFELEAGAYDSIMKEYYAALQAAHLSRENEVFNVDAFVNGVCKL